MRKFLMAAAVGLGSVATSLPAQASIILSLVGNPVAVTSGGTVTGYDYTYNATLSSDEELSPSTSAVFFTLYDFGKGSLVSDNLVDPKAWAFTLNTNFTTYAQAEAPNNKASIDDVRATYTGTTYTGATAGGQVGDLGTFTLFTANTGAFAVFADNQDAQLQKYAPGTATNDTEASNIDSVAVPTLGRAAVTVPEPASLTLLGAGLVGLVMKRRRRIAA